MEGMTAPTSPSTRMHNAAKPLAGVELTGPELENFHKHIARNASPQHPISPEMLLLSTRMHNAVTPLAGVELTGPKLENFHKVSDEYSLGRCSTGEEFDLSALPRPLSVSTRKSSPGKDALLEVAAPYRQKCFSTSRESQSGHWGGEQSNIRACSDTSGISFRQYATRP
ncbi:hypothetical protein MMC10_004452 [Thelotrema lepadinum]|nr:hypothetical protein [Thelotrema lepadinum]